MTIQQALSGFYAANDFEDDGITKSSIAWLKVGPFKVPIPNPDARKKALWIHDVNHLATGYSTKWIGETSISAWELATGGWGTNVFVWMIIMGGFLIGVLVYPVSTFKAFLRGRRCKPVVGLGLTKKSLMNLEIEELKSMAGLDKNTDYQADIIDILHFLKWILLALSAYLLPLILVGILVVTLV
jgi:hypothetical protein